MDPDLPKERGDFGSDFVTTKKIFLCTGTVIAFKNQVKNEVRAFQFLFCMIPKLCSQSIPGHTGTEIREAGAGLFPASGFRSFGAGAEVLKRGQLRNPCNLGCAEPEPKRLRLSVFGSSATE